MLTDRSLRYYFDHLQDKRLNFDDLFAAILNRFLTVKHTHRILREWDSIERNKIMHENSGKRATECLNLLKTKPEDIQSGLTKATKRSCS